MKAFKPHPLLPTGQLQTVAAQLLPKPPPPAPFEVLGVGLSGGDRLNLHVNLPAADGPGPVVMLVHGLGGSSESTYMLRLAAKLNARGIPAVRFNHRGCGDGGAGLARGIYHAGRAEDIHAALLAVAARFPGRPVLPVGFSLSANMLLKLLADEAASRELTACPRALAVCPPVDLELCSRALDTRGNWHIDRYYTVGLMAVAHAQAARFPDTPPPRFPKRMSLRIFDEVYTAPRAGFKDRAQYYEASSAKPVAHRISIQTSVLAAADDPVIPEESFAGIKFSSSVDFRMERRGGHMGFISAAKTAYGDRRWMDEAVMDWVLGGPR